MSPAVARALMPGVDGFRYCGLRYTLAEVYTSAEGKVFLIPTYGARNTAPAPVMFPVNQCDPAPARSPAKRRVK